MKVSFDLARNQVTIEGDGPDLMSLLQLVRDVAPKVSEIRLVTTPANAAMPPAGASPAGNGASGSAEGEKSPQGGPTMREFARSMAPANLSEKIVAIGAYLERFESRSSFSPKEISDYFRICGFEKPAQMAVALFDARRKYGFLEKAGYGLWKLSTAGQNLAARRLNDNGGGA